MPGERCRWSGIGHECAGRDSGTAAGVEHIAAFQIRLSLRSQDPGRHGIAQQQRVAGSHGRGERGGIAANQFQFGFQLSVLFGRAGPPRFRRRRVVRRKPKRRGPKPPRAGQ